VIYGDDVMPGVRGKRLEGDVRAFPLFGGVVEDTPSEACVVGLPGIIVGVSVRILLALEFNGLWSARILRRDVEVELVAQIADWIRDRRMLDEVVASCV
jgi:hypothetical protein